MRKLSRRHRPRSSQGATRPFEGMRTVNPHAAGVDIGAQAIMACVPDGDDQQIVRACGTSTAALESLADWCIDRGIQTVAMASTGVDGMPLFETLEARGIQGCLISAPSLTHVPGRQSAVLACQGSQTLHSYGVRSASFRPEADSWHCGRCCAIAPHSLRLAPRLSSTGTRPWYRCISRCPKR